MHMLRIVLEVMIFSLSALTVLCVVATLRPRWLVSLLPDMTEEEMKELLKHRKEPLP
jgi:hypothetical protein